MIIGIFLLYYFSHWNSAKIGRDHLLSYIQLLEHPPLHSVHPTPAVEQSIPKEEKNTKFRQKSLLDEITFFVLQLSTYKML